MTKKPRKERDYSGQAPTVAVLKDESEHSEFKAETNLNYSGLKSPERDERS